MSVISWNCRGLGSTPAVRLLTEEVSSKNPTLVFLAETKAQISHIKGLQQKLNFTQGIVVPSDGWSGSLALLWKEGPVVHFKSCSHSHIDVVVVKEDGGGTWRATGFYGHPDSGMRFSSWELLKKLHTQAALPWVIFGDFNEILHLDEKLGGKERDSNQMDAFRETLNACGLYDLGFVGQRYTWCNGRFGDQCTLIRLDRIVANDAWRTKFPEALVYHVSMTASDHCLLALSLKRSRIQRKRHKRFFFEAMWAREAGCKEVIE